MNVEYMISIINELRDTWYKAPNNYYQKRSDFEYQSYKRSAINEIISYLLENYTENPIKNVENFRNLMNEFACNTKKGGANFIFSIYYDVATDVLDSLLRGMIKQWP